MRKLCSNSAISKYLFFEQQDLSRADAAPLPGGLKRLSYHLHIAKLLILFKFRALDNLKNIECDKQITLFNYCFIFL